MDIEEEETFHSRRSREEDVPQFPEEEINAQLAFFSVPYKEPEPTSRILPNTIHVYGVDVFVHSEDLKKIFVTYEPVHVSWMSGSACNVILSSPENAALALAHLTALPDSSADPESLPSSSADAALAFSSSSSSSSAVPVDPSTMTHEQNVLRDSTECVIRRRRYVLKLRYATSSDQKDAEWMKEKAPHYDAFVDKYAPELKQFMKQGRRGKGGRNKKRTRDDVMMDGLGYIEDPEKMKARMNRFGVDESAFVTPSSSSSSSSSSSAPPPMDTEELERRKRRSQRFGIPEEEAKTESVVESQEKRERSAPVGSIAEQALKKFEERRKKRSEGILRSEYVQDAGVAVPLEPVSSAVSAEAGVVEGGIVEEVQ